MVTVSICTGTTCFVMGASELMLLEEYLPEDIKDQVEITGMTCFGKCKNSEHGKAPFVMVDDKLVSEATIDSVLDAIREKLNA